MSEDEPVAPGGAGEEAVGGAAGDAEPPEETGSSARPTSETGGTDAAGTGALESDAGEADRGEAAGEADTGDAAGGAVTEYTTEERGISSRVRLYWSGRLVIGLTVLTFFGRIGAARLGLDPGVVPALAVGLAVLGFGWVHLRYRAWRYHLREDALYLERGVITQVKTVAPHVRIQHVDTSRGPLERALGLSTLVVYTAGSRGADVSIPGLTPEEAGDLQRRLKELAIETEGGDAL